MKNPTDTFDDDAVASLLSGGGRQVDTDAIADASVALARDIAVVTPARARRRRVGTVAISVAALAVLAPTGAAAYGWSTHTGWFGQPDKFTEDVDTSEVLGLCAPDFPETARGLIPSDLLLPAGATVAEARSVVIRNLTRDCATSGQLMQATGVTASGESYAWCSWVNSYVADPATRDDAAIAMKHYANDELIHTVDSDGDAARWMNKIADAAATGDTQQVRYEQKVNCDGGAYGWRP
jgi:hypothetical protein